MGLLMMIRDYMAITVALIAAAAALVFTGVYAYVYARRVRNSVLAGGEEENSEWLFDSFGKRAYRAFFGDADPEVIAIRLGIDVEEHNRYCSIIKRDPGIESLVVQRIFAIVILIAGLLLSFIFGTYIIVLVSLVPFMLLFMLGRTRAKRAAEAARSQMAEDVPRFLDLLQPVLETGIAIDAALRMVCEKLDTLLTRELREAFNESEMGVGDWQTVLEGVAQKYDVDTLNSFVLSVTSAYSKGVSITEVVAREVAETRESYILHKKDNAKKMTNSILIPIYTCQVVPLILFMLIPSLMEMMGGFF